MSNSGMHIPSLTSLRGIAAIWVLFFHLDVIIFYRDLGPLVPHAATGVLQKGYLWVDFFFILSGFIITHVYRDKLRTLPWKTGIPEYLWCRFTRLYPLHIFTLIVAIVVATPVAKMYPQVVDGSWRTYFDWNAIPSHLLFTNAMKQHTYLSWNIASWSIGAEWWTYVTMIPVFLFLPVGKKRIYIPLAVVSYGLLWLLMFKLGNNKLDITYDYGFLRCLLEFTIGICVYQAYRGAMFRSFFQSDVTAFGVFIAIIACFHWQWHDLVSIPLFALLILSASVNQSRFKRLLSARVPQYLGKVSYSVYLIHSLWFLVFWNVFPHIDFSTSNGTLSVSVRLIYVFSFIALTILCSHFSYRYVEVGVREYLRRNTAFKLRQH